MPVPATVIAAGARCKWAKPKQPAPRRAGSRQKLTTSICNVWFRWLARAFAPLRTRGDRLSSRASFQPRLTAFLKGTLLMRAHRLCRLPCLEQLESRQLLALGPVALDDGLLSVVGTSKRDRIEVAQQDDLLLVRFNGVQHAFQ